MRAISVLAEGASVRATTRLVGLHKTTALSLLVEVGEGCKRLHDAIVRDLTADVMELDEVWTFVGCKEAHRNEKHPDDWGDAYTFLALDARTRLIVAYRTDRRSVEATNAFAADLRAKVLGRPQITTDGFIPYLDAIERAFGDRVHYAQILKTYWGMDQPEGDVRYSRGRVVRSVKRPIRGAPADDKISTSYVERQNWTIRTQQRRFTRLANGFSRKVENLRAAVALYAAHYNFVKVHKTLRVTPAMEMGLTDHVWSVEELVAAAEDHVVRLPQVRPMKQLALPGIA